MTLVSNFCYCPYQKSFCNSMGFAVRFRSAGQKYGPTCHQRDVLTSQSLSPWCDCRRLGSTLGSWRWQDINVGNPLWRRTLLWHIIETNGSSSMQVHKVLKYHSPMTGNLPFKVHTKKKGRKLPCNLQCVQLAGTSKRNSFFVPMHEG